MTKLAAIRRTARRESWDDEDFRQVFRALRDGGAGIVGKSVIDTLFANLSRLERCYKRRNRKDGPIAVIYAKLSRVRKLKKANRKSPTELAAQSQLRDEEKRWGWLREWALQHAPEHVKQAIRNKDPRALKLARRAYFKAKALKRGDTEC